MTVLSTKRGNKMWQCGKCDEYRFDSVIKCNCKKFTIDHHGEPYERYAMDFEDAAMKWAQKYNDEGSLIDSEEDVVVTSDTGETKVFTVGAETDVQYSATEKKA